ncbi:hypothetical protein AAV94_04375 [Lampropedia cohaerens]|uniref:Glycerate kinase n=1 Tax=Lampropedia cohaerens TaxID=1610491 RepID=A0A0U1Q1F5_9BURK|nr:hypothetical protein [Lampropedia cohaerens]KKW68604.1 hypothetical protein AAV94_04375 [Lampropedia cohaerens]
MTPHLKAFALLATAAVLLVVGYANRGIGGLLLVLGAIVFLTLLYVMRITRTLRAAADTPKGCIGSAVMLNAQLREGRTMLQVIQQTRALGDLLHACGDTETYRWRDPGGAWVDATFVAGRLKHWQLGRPEAASEPPQPCP